MNAEDFKILMDKSEILKIAEKMAYEAGLTYHPETNEEWSYIDFDNSRSNCIIFVSTRIHTVNDVILYTQDDCLELLKKAIDELQNIMLKNIKLSKAMKKHEIRSAGNEYEA